MLIQTNYLDDLPFFANVIKGLGQYFLEPKCLTSLSATFFGALKKLNSSNTSISSIFLVGTQLSVEINSTIFLGVIPSVFHFQTNNLTESAPLSNHHLSENHLSQDLSQPLSNLFHLLELPLSNLFHLSYQPLSEDSNDLANQPAAISPYLSAESLFFKNVERTDAKTISHLSIFNKS